MRKKTFPLLSGTAYFYPHLQSKPDNGPVLTVVPQTGGPGPQAYLWVGAKNGACFGTLEGAKLRDLARRILAARSE